MESSYRGGGEGSPDSAGVRTLLCCEGAVCLAPGKAGPFGKSCVPPMETPVVKDNHAALLNEISVRSSAIQLRIV